MHVSCSIRSHVMLPFNFSIYYQNNEDIKDLNDSKLKEINTVYFCNIEKIKNIKFYCYNHNVKSVMAFYESK